MPIKGESGDYFVVRTPRLPLKALNGIHRTDPATVSTFLKVLRTIEPRVDDALFLASRTLHDEIKHHLDNNLQFPEKLAVTAYKYLLRMSSRATPFGLFSSIAHGTVEPAQTDIRLTGNIAPHTRIDMELFESMRDTLLLDQACYPFLTFFPNSSIHIQEDHYRFFIYRNRDGRQECHWIRVAKNPLIEAILQRARTGATFAALLETAAAFHIPQERGKDFIIRLTYEQLLHTDLEPTISGDTQLSAIQSLLGKVTGTGNVPSTYSGYLKLWKLLSRVNKQNGRLARLAAPMPVTIFQTDSLTHTHTCKLGKSLTDTITREIAELHPLYQNPIPKRLCEFRDRFSERYGEQEVPLLEALDLDRGVGYGNPTAQYFHENPLLDGLSFAHAANARTGDASEKIFRKYLSTVPERGQHILKLEPEDLAGLQQGGGIPILPDQGCYALGNLLTTNPGKQPDPQNFRFHLLACGGPSSIPLMTRFAHLDSRLLESLKDSAAAEQQLYPDEVIAEIVHMPGKRIGNILLRPSLHPYEIPVLGRSTLPMEYQIGLSDILVSVTAGEVVLRSKRLDKIIRPRLSSAHNYQSGMNVYRFLCDVQEQHAYRLFWDWGDSPRYHTFLPRVCYKHLILHRAQWNIPSHVYREIKNLAKNRAIDTVRHRYGIPEDVVLADGDNEIPLKLTNELSERIFLHALKAGNVRLYEPLYPEFFSPVVDERGRPYHNEIIIPFFLRGNSSMARKRTVNRNSSVQRVFPPGSEWVYLKLYCGQKETDRIIANHLSPFLAGIAKEIPLKKWYFIRYRDTDHHLRVRFHLEDAGNAPKLMTLLNNKFGKLIESRTVHSIQYDTYIREVERYGGKSIELCEAIFHQHSEFVLRIAPMFLKPELGQGRWMLAMKGVDQLLDAFAISNPGKLDLVSAWRSAMLTEYAKPDELKRKLDVRYREVKSNLTDYMERGGIYPPVHGDLRSSIVSFANGIKLAFGKDWSISGRNATTNLLFSLSHMNLNRMFYSNQRENELVVYHLLAKYYLTVSKKYERFLDQKTPSVLPEPRVAAFQ